MDFQYAAWHIFNLFVSPFKVYRHVSIAQAARNQWASQDPVIILICTFCWTLIRLAYTIRSYGFVGIFITVSVLAIDIIIILLLGVFIWLLCNTLFQSKSSLYSDQRLEYRYAIDVICDGLIVSIPWFFGSPLLWIASKSIVLSNFGFFGGACHFLYVVFVGLTVLPFLSKTFYILYVIFVLVFIFFVCTALGFNMGLIPLWYI